ncbi:MAG: Uma2 family endonuclease [Saprospiraceae bacterium]
METLVPAARHKKASRKIPEGLVYEIVRGRPVYYRGYREVLDGTKHIETIMAESSLQAWLKARLGSLLLTLLEPKGYEIASGELGLLMGDGSRRGADIAVYRAEDFYLSNHFLSIPPEVVVEIDIQASLENQTEMDYVLEKIEDYLRFGVKQVIWVFTSSRKIMVATPAKPWLTMGWETTVETIGGASFNLETILAGRRVR